MLMLSTCMKCSDLISRGKPVFVATPSSHSMSGFFICGIGYNFGMRGIPGSIEHVLKHSTAVAGELETGAQTRPGG